jgi:hypothetical protein
MAMLQLNPPIPLTLDTGEPVWALVILDYGPDYDSLFLVAGQHSRELWWLPNSRLRLGDNFSLGRPGSNPPKASMVHPERPTRLNGVT